MDPLSQVFSLLDVQSLATARLEAGGSWALRFAAKPYLKFNAVLRGCCWIELPGVAPCRLEEGDTFLLANAPPFVLSTAPGLPASDGTALFAGNTSGVARHGGDDTVLIGGGFVFGSEDARLLLDALPPFLHVPAQEPAAAILRRTLQLLDDELDSGRMGESLMTGRLADILLVQALRAHVAVNGPEAAGWIGALSDRRIGRAIRLMHAEIGRRWTVDALANAVGMSRSGFALRFTALVGVPPLEYLLRWRMQVARGALKRGDQSVAELAASLGYASESAFGNAFRRVVGHAPRRYGAMRRAAAASGVSTSAGSAALRHPGPSPSGS